VKENFHVEARRM